MKKAIFLDFDGVLFDTVKESFAVTEFASNKIKSIKDLDFQGKRYKLFAKYRYLIGPAWNYFYLSKLIDVRAKNRINIEQEYEKLLKKRKKIDYRNFELDFFNIRDYLIRNYEKFWLSLNIPYNFFYQLIDIIKKNQNLFFIITTKNKNTIKKILRHYKVNISNKRIFGKFDFDIHRSKKKILDEIIKKYKISRGIYIDDNRGHLDACKNNKEIETLQPNWGYIKKSDYINNEKEILLKIKKFIMI